MARKNGRDSGTKCDPGKFRTGSKPGSEMRGGTFADAGGAK